MTRRTIILISAGVLICGSVSSAVYEKRQVWRCLEVRSASIQKRDEFQRQLRDMKTQIGDAERDARSAEQKLEHERACLEEMIARRKASLAAELVANPMKVHVLDQYALLDKSPEFQQLFNECRQASYGLEYQRLAQRLKLSPEQTTAIGRIYDEFALSRADMSAALKSQGVSEDDPLVKKMVQENNDEVCRKLQEVLGENGEQMFFRYKNWLQDPSRTVADAVAQNLFYSDTPLPAQSADKLANLIYKYTQTVQGTKQTDWDAVQAKAGEFMTQQQIAALAQQREYERLKARTDEIYKKAVEKE